MLIFKKRISRSVHETSICSDELLVCNLLHTKLISLKVNIFCGIGDWKRDLSTDPLLFLTFSFETGKTKLPSGPYWSLTHDSPLLVSQNDKIIGYGTLVHSKSTILLIIILWVRTMGRCTWSQRCLPAWLGWTDPCQTTSLFVCLEPQWSLPSLTHVSERIHKCLIPRTQGHPVVSAFRRMTAPRSLNILHSSSRMQSNHYKRMRQKALEGLSLPSYRGLQHTTSVPKDCLVSRMTFREIVESLRGET